MGGGEDFQTTAAKSETRRYSCQCNVRFSEYAKDFEVKLME
jgi:hypothetical protein